MASRLLRSVLGSYTNPRPSRDLWAPAVASSRSLANRPVKPGAEMIEDAEGGKCSQNSKTWTSIPGNFGVKNSDDMRNILDNLQRIQKTLSRLEEKVDTLCDRV